jgi:hypothetical protein
VRPRGFPHKTLPSPGGASRKRFTQFLTQPTARPIQAANCSSRPIGMELHEPMQHRPISNPTFLHLRHSFQEKLCLSEVYRFSRLSCLLASLRVAQTAGVMTIESHTVPYPELTLRYIGSVSLWPRLLPCSLKVSATRCMTAQPDKTMPTESVPQWV